MFLRTGVFTACIAMLCIAVSNLKGQGRDDIAQCEARVIRLLDAEQYSEAIAEADRLCDLTVAKYGRHHQEYAISLRTLGEAYRQADKIDLAIATWKRSLQLLQEFKPTDHLGITVVASSLAQAYWQLDMYDQVIPISQLAIDAADEYGEDDRTASWVWKAYFVLGDAHWATGNSKRAKKAYEEAAEVCEDEFGEDSPGYRRCQEALADLKLGKKPRRKPQPEPKVQAVPHPTAVVEDVQPQSEVEPTPESPPAPEDTTGIEPQLLKLSAQQQALVDEFGYPDTFVLSSYEETIEGGTTRIRDETWYYYRVLTNFSFINGKFVASNSIDRLPDDLIYPKYSPDMFQVGMTLAEVKKLLGDAKGVGVEVNALGLNDKSLDNFQLYFAGQISLAFVEDSLCYVLSAPGDPARIVKEVTE